MVKDQNSLVSAFKQDQRNVGLCAAESLGYFGLGERPTQSSDRSHLLCGQKFFKSSDASDVDRMLFVHTVVNPFKVYDDVIPLVSVDVIDHREAIRVGDECLSDEPMDVNILWPRVFPQTDFSVSEFLGARSEKLPVAYARLRACAKPVKASNSPQIADLVEAFEGEDVSPLFINNDIHTTGCPSGNGGLAIKSPSHAATFDGFAIMAANPDTYNRRIACRFH